MPLPHPPVVPASATSSALITVDSTLVRWPSSGKATFLSLFPYSFLWTEQGFVERSSTLVLKRNLPYIHKG